jgi:hypothetical protein
MVLAAPLVADAELLLSRSFWMSASVIPKPAGQPSMTQPTAVPWLSPYVVTENAFPKVFEGMRYLEDGLRTEDPGRAFTILLAAGPASLDSPN